MSEPGVPFVGEPADNRDTGPSDEATIRRYEERLAREPGSLVFATLAYLYRKAGRLAEAITLCRDGLRRVPNYTTARLVLAKALLAAGDLPAAVVELNGIVESNPKDAPCHRLLAEAHRRRGDLDASVRHLEAAVRLDPGDRESRTALRLLQVRSGVSSDNGIGRVLRDDLFATATFGAICLEQGLIEEAADIFARLLRREPGDERAREGLERALAAKAGRKRG